ncbi:GAF domain-containing protein [Waterburya agarophytonicola K14]|uniref:histidine kinase n=1 Tax=Waterburya agarophytonicola KI4 TaxID=2874699 RepID=A0A964FE28_9CYAN|nr:DICT sensory domain-containing protein [Waterburya agarophytonicola]MCC0176230.1 GAF domain-containing protein [Waterburya agarophytonicola KI4]
MSISNSVVEQLLAICTGWRPQMYFKSSLTALSHAMEDLVLNDSDTPLVIASFQRERFYRQEAHRYKRISRKSDQVYVLAAPETDFSHDSTDYETVAFEPTDALAQEWHLVIIGQNYASCLICREKNIPVSPKENNQTTIDPNRRFEGIWTFDRQVTITAAQIMLDRIGIYRPELESKLAQARQLYLSTVEKVNSGIPIDSPLTNPDPFVQRLVTYLQAGQYKLLKANKSLAAKQRKEQLLNSVSDAVRRSLNTKQILQVAVQKLGEGVGVCRCIIYRCHEDDTVATVDREFNSPGIKSVRGQQWQLANNPLFEEAIATTETIRVDNTLEDERITKLALEKGTHKFFQNLIQNYSISSWLLVPIFYHGKLLGVLELHHCEAEPIPWKKHDVALVDAIATQVGVALIQAEAYADLEHLNQQLEALDRTRSNLVAIVGHELRTPLSTIQVCLESLASEPDMPTELSEVMLDTALSDAERMRNLVQDFLTLSRLEGGAVEWNLETLSISECIDLAVSNVKARNHSTKLPQIDNLTTPEDLPLIQVDGEWLVEVLAKLLDNACKFTQADGKIAIAVQTNGGKTLEVTVSDTGRGIETNSLETVFDRFYQEEGALRRSAGGTGLGLAICRQIVKNWGGEIWAESPGKDRGSIFHFTIPIKAANYKSQSF